MAANAPITTDQKLYRGTARKLRFKAYSTLPTPISPAGVLVDASTLGALQWVLSENRGDAVPKVTKATSGDGIAVIGAFNADPALNTQWIEVTLEAADTKTAATPAGSYVHELRATASDGVLADGAVALLEPVTVPA